MVGDDTGFLWGRDNMTQISDADMDNLAHMLGIGSHIKNANGAKDCSLQS